MRSLPATDRRIRRMQADALRRRILLPRTVDPASNRPTPLLQSDLGSLPGGLWHSYSHPHAFAQLPDRPMADHPDVGFRNAKKTSDIHAAFFIVKTHDDH